MEKKFLTEYILHTKGFFNLEDNFENYVTFLVERKKYTQLLFKHRAKHFTWIHNAVWRISESESSNIRLTKQMPQ